MSLSAAALIALGYHLASRLAYVLYIGLVLSRQERLGHLTRRYGIEEAFRHFRRVALLLMLNDGGSFVALCVATPGTLPDAVSGRLTVMLGVILVIVGVVTKAWAAATLGSRAYYWYNFFGSNDRAGPSSAGPYRFLKNPMYTVGYVQIYGLALVTGSLPGLIAALFDQIAILVFYWRVEKPHFDRSVAGAT